MTNRIGGVLSQVKPKTTRLLQLYPLRTAQPIRSQIVEDLLEFEATGKQAAVKTMVSLLNDLHQRGKESQYVQKLQGLVLFELKPNARGGHKGGARVYLVFTEHHEALIFNAEVKAQGQTTPSAAKIEQAYEMLHAYMDGNLKFAPHKGGS